MNPNSFIPAGSTSSYQQPIADARTPVGERFSNPNTTMKRIELARVQDEYKRKLQEEFDKIDLNKDGQLTPDELHEFFLRGGLANAEEREKVVDNIIDMCDADNNGKISS